MGMLTLNNHNMNKINLNTINITKNLTKTNLRSEIFYDTKLKNRKTYRKILKCKYEFNANYFSENTPRGLEYAKFEAFEDWTQSIDVCHILLGLLRQRTNCSAAHVLACWGLKYENLKPIIVQYKDPDSWTWSKTVSYHAESHLVFAEAENYALLFGDGKINSLHILMAIFSIREHSLYNILRKRIRFFKELQRLILRLPPGIEIHPDDEEFFENQFAKLYELTTDSLDIINSFGEDLTLKAIEGRNSPVIGRQKEIKRVIRVLGRKSKNNPCLVGEPGVGKTAIAEGLAALVANDKVPEFLKGKRVINLDVPKIVSGTKYRGDFEVRMINIMTMAKTEPSVILFIDEIHTIVGAGSTEGSLDAANMLKPALSRGEIKLIGATTTDEFKKYIRKDGALERRFQEITVPEPTAEEAVEILVGLRTSFENHHKIVFTDQAVEACVRIAVRYITEKFLPDKAIDLLDETGAFVKMRDNTLGRNTMEYKSLTETYYKRIESLKTKNLSLIKSLILKEIDFLNNCNAVVQTMQDNIIPMVKKLDTDNVVVIEDVENVFEEMSGIKISKADDNEKERLLNLENTLHKAVIGQHKAVTAIASAIRRSRAGLRDPTRPIAGFLFAGPTGVGKSELAKALSREFYQSEEAMIRFDMAEFSEKHTVARLLGSPPGYVGYSEGGQLTEAVRRKPQTVLLFDEVEKGNQGCFDIFLGILEDGRLADTSGKVVNFKETIVIFTSNLGAKGVKQAEEDFKKTAGRNATIPRELLLKTYNESISKFFRPEIINRMDEIIIFDRLEKSEVEKIFNIFIKDIKKRSDRISLNFVISPQLKDYILDNGYNPAFGARPLKRTIARFVEEPLAKLALSDNNLANGRILLHINNDNKTKVLYIDHVDEKIVPIIS